MTPSAAWKLARGAARLQQVRFAHPHAYERMQERGATQLDVATAIMTSTAVLPHPHLLHRFRLIGGTDLTGDPLNVVISIDGNVVTVVTILGT